MIFLLTVQIFFVDGAFFSVGGVFERALGEA